MDRLTPWLSRTRLAYLALALVLAVAGWRLAATQSPAARGPVVSPLATIAAPPSAPGLVVHVVGAVRRPGVYELQPGARGLVAVRRAGGPTKRADLSGLNLAAEVVDGQQIVVPERGQAPRPGAGAGGHDGPISLSSATVEQLDELDGIGPTLAQRIVDWRTQNGGFRSVDQLLDVPGIGETRLEALRSRVTP